MKFIAPLLIPALVVFAMACDNDDDAEPAATAEPPTIVAPTEAPETPTAEASPTTEPAATNTPDGGTSPTVPPTDGTVFPQNPGSTDAVPLKSLPDPNVSVYTLTDVRVGAHPESGGWDRIVFEFEDVEGFPGAHPGGLIEYTDEVFQCGSGEPVEVEGEEILHVRFEATQAHDDDGQLTIDSLEIEGPGNAIVEARSICDFEGIVEWAIGVTGEQNFKVAFLEDPARVVLDIKWP